MTRAEVVTGQLMVRSVAACLMAEIIPGDLNWLLPIIQFTLASEVTSVRRPHILAVLTVDFHCHRILSCCSRLFV